MKVDRPQAHLNGSYLNMLGKKFQNTYYPTLSSWWFQPIWKNMSQIGSFPQFSGWKKKFAVTTTQLWWWFTVGILSQDLTFHHHNFSSNPLVKESPWSVVSWPWKSCGLDSREHVRRRGGGGIVLGCHSRKVGSMVNGSMSYFTYWMYFKKIVYGVTSPTDPKLLLTSGHIQLMPDVLLVLVVNNPPNNHDA